MRTYPDGERKAATVIAPATDATAFRTIILFDLGTSHDSDALPDAWRGKYVRITPLGGNVWYNVDTAAQEIDRSVAGSDGQTANAKVGAYLANGSSEDVMLPNIEPNTETMYFNREGDTASTKVEVRLVSP